MNALISSHLFRLKSAVQHREVDLDSFARQCRCFEPERVGGDDLSILVEADDPAGQHVGQPQRLPVLVRQVSGGSDCRERIITEVGGADDGHGEFLGG